MRTLILAGAVAVAFALTAGTAAADSFVIGGTYTQGGSSSDLSVVDKVYAGGTITIDPGFSGNYFDWKVDNGVGTFSTIATQIGGYYFLDSYAVGDTIGAGTLGDHDSVVDDWDTILVNDATAGVWGATHSGFLGFRNAAGQYGWVKYDFVRSGLFSTMTLLGGEYNTTVGADIVIGGAVPEPGSIALLGLGLVGLGIATRRRKARTS